MGRIDVHTIVGFWNPLILRNVELILQKLQSRNQSRQSLVFTHVVKPVQPLVCLALASFTIRKFIGGESFFIGRRIWELGGFCKIFGRALVVMVFFFVETSERFVKLWPIRIIFDPTLEKILPQREVFPLRLDP